MVILNILSQGPDNIYSITRNRSLNEFSTETFNIWGWGGAGPGGGGGVGLELTVYGEMVIF